MAIARPTRNSGAELLADGRALGNQPLFGSDPDPGAAQITHDSVAGNCGDVRTRWNIEPSGGGLGDNGAGDGVIGSDIDARSVGHDHCVGDAVPRDTNHSGSTSSQCSRLVKNDRVDAARAFEHIRATNDNSTACSSARSHEKRHRCGEPQRTRACDHQGGNRHRYCASQVPLLEVPPHSGAKSKNDHDGNENRGDPIDKLLNGRLPRLRLFHHSGEASEFGRRPNRRGFDDQSTARVNDSARHPCSRANGNRHAFTRHRTRVHAGGPFDDDSVRRNNSAGENDEQVTDLNRPRGHRDFAPVDQQDGMFCGQIEQGRQGLASSSLRICFEVSPEQNKHRDHCGRFKIQRVGGVAKKRERHFHADHPRVRERNGVQRPQKGDKHAE